MTETTETTARKIDVTDGRDIAAELRTKISEARAAVNDIDLNTMTCDQDILDELDWCGVGLTGDGENDGMQWRQQPGWAPSNTAITLNLSAPFEAWATTAVWQMTDDDGSWIEDTDGMSLVEGEDEISTW